MTKKGPAQNDHFEIRRSVLKAVGGSAVLLSVSGIAACSGGDSSAPQRPAPSPAPAAEPAAPAPAAPAPAPSPAPAAPAAAAPSGQMPVLNPSDPQAQALGYVSDAASIDANAQPRFVPGQACANCSLYLGQAGAAAGPCSIFPGKLVNGTGWCTVYSPKA